MIEKINTVVSDFSLPMSAIGICISTLCMHPGFSQTLNKLPSIALTRLYNSPSLVCWLHLSSFYMHACDWLMPKMRRKTIVLSLWSINLNNLLMPKLDRSDGFGWATLMKLSDFSSEFLCRLVILNLLLFYMWCLVSYELIFFSVCEIWLIK